MIIQGGGDSNLESEKINKLEKYFSTSLHLPMELVSSPETMQSRDINNLSEITSEAQITQAISIFCKQQEKNCNHCIYMKFPFRMLCNDRLKELRTYFEQVSAPKKLQKTRIGLKMLKLHY